MSDNVPCASLARAPAGLGSFPTRRLLRVARALAVPLAANLEFLFEGLQFAPLHLGPHTR
jgi:hypothetical protein